MVKSSAIGLCQEVCRYCCWSWCPVCEGSSCFLGVGSEASKRLALQNLVSLQPQPTAVELCWEAATGATRGASDSVERGNVVFLLETLKVYKVTFNSVSI